MNRHTFAGFAIARRCVAVSVLRGHQLEHVRRKFLSSRRDEAMNTVTEFVRRSVEEFALQSAAIRVPGEAETRTSDMNKHLQAVLRSSSVSIRPVEERSLLDAFAKPPLMTRHQLREAILLIWPALRHQKLGKEALDATAVALYGQIEQSLDINLQPP